MDNPEQHPCQGDAPPHNGIASARDLPRLYACLGNGGTLDGVTIMRPQTLAAATKRQTFRPDAVLIIPIGWALGYMTGGSMVSVSGPRETSFGHAGFGGSRAFALAQAARDCAAA